MHLRIQHNKQPWPWGCQYHALYALVEDEKILANTMECESGRFRILMRELGYIMHPLYADAFCKLQAPREWWEGLLRAYGNMDESQLLPLLLSVPSLKYAEHKVVHCVALAVQNLAEGVLFTVLDSNTEAAQVYESLDAFLASPYGKAHDVYQVVSNSPDAFETMLGIEGPHVTDEVRAAYAASTLEPALN